MRLALPILFATATAAADPAVELRWTRVEIDDPTGDTARAIVDELDGLKITRALEACAKRRARATVSIFYRERRVTVDAGTDFPLARCIEGALRGLTWRATKQWVVAELHTVPVRGASLTTRNTPKIRVEGHVYSSRYSDTQKPRR